MNDDVTPEDVRKALNTAGQVWRMWTHDPAGADNWARLWQAIDTHPDTGGLILNLTLNAAVAAFQRLTSDAGVDPGTGDGELWAPNVGPEAPPHHQVMGPVMAAIANGDPEAAADVVIAMSDPSNDWVLKTIAECLAIATGEPGPQGFFDMDFVVGGDQ